MCLPANSMTAESSPKVGLHSAHPDSTLSQAPTADCTWHMGEPIASSMHCCASTDAGDQHTLHDPTPTCAVMPYQQDHTGCDPAVGHPGASAHANRACAHHSCRARFMQQLVRAASNSAAAAPAAAPPVAAAHGCEGCCDSGCCEGWVSCLMRYAGDCTCGNILNLSWW